MSSFRKFDEFSIFRIRRVMTIIFGIFTITSYAYGSFSFLRNSSTLTPFLLSEACLFLMLCAGYLMNDYCDESYDIINRPESVYIGKTLSRSRAKIIIILLFAAGFLISILVNFYFFALLVFLFFILLFYNLNSKKISWLKPITISLLAVSIYPMSIAISQGGFDSPRRDSLFIFPIWLFLSTLSFELASDAKDAMGDNSSGKGYVSRFGQDRIVIAARTIAMLTIPIAAAPYFAGMCGNVYIVLTALSAILLTAGVFVRKLDFRKIVFYYIAGITLASIIDLAVYT